MKSLASIIAEGVLDKDGGMGNIPEITGALKIFWDTWVNTNAEKNQFDRGFTKYKVAKPTAIQVAKKLISTCQSLGLYDYKDYKQFRPMQDKGTYGTNPNAVNILAKGDAVLLFHEAKRQIGTVTIVYMYGGKQHVYEAKFNDDGVYVSLTNQRTNRPIAADSGAVNGFAIPGEVAEKIFKANAVSN